MIINCDCQLTGGCKKCMPHWENPFLEFIEEDIELAEMGMDEYNKQLLKEDKE